jgi:hypothetical protein
MMTGGRRFLGGDILGAVGGIEGLCPGPGIELFAGETRSGSGGNYIEMFDEPNSTSAILESATGPTGPPGKAMFPLRAMGAMYGPTGCYRS